MKAPRPEHSASFLLTVALVYGMVFTYIFVKKVEHRAPAAVKYVLPDSPPTIKNHSSHTLLSF